MKSRPVAIIVNGQVQEIWSGPAPPCCARCAMSRSHRQGRLRGRGTCTVQIDGTPVLACCTLTELVDGGAITTA